MEGSYLAGQPGGRGLSRMEKTKGRLIRLPFCLC
jgi:hypothetical protein